MKNKKLILLFISILIIIGTLWSLNNYIKDEIRNVQVFIYKTDLPKNTIITKDDIIAKNVPAERYASLLELNPDNIVNKALKTDVVGGSFVYKKQLMKEAEIDIFETIDLSKYRKIAMPVNYLSTFGGDIKRGQTVDLIYTGRGTTEDNKEFTYTKTFLQNVLVYNVLTKSGNIYSPSIKSETGDGVNIVTGEKKEQKEGPEILTLAIPLEQVEEIQTRLATGQISIVGRFKDSKSYETLGYVMGGTGELISGEVRIETDGITIIENSAKANDWNDSRENTNNSSNLDEINNKNNVEEAKDSVKDKNDVSDKVKNGTNENENTNEIIIIDDEASEKKAGALSKISTSIKNIINKVVDLLPF